MFPDVVGSLAHMVSFNHMHTVLDETHDGSGLLNKWRGGGVQLHARHIELVKVLRW